jgi:hypothetical protein
LNTSHSRDLHLAASTVLRYTLPFRHMRLRVAAFGNGVSALSYNKHDVFPFSLIDPVHTPHISLSAGMCQEMVEEVTCSPFHCLGTRHVYNAIKVLTDPPMSARVRPDIIIMVTDLLRTCAPSNLAGLQSLFEVPIVTLDVTAQHDMRDIDVIALGPRTMHTPMGPLYARAARRALASVATHRGKPVQRDFVPNVPSYMSLVDTRVAVAPLQGVHAPRCTSVDHRGVDVGGLCEEYTNPLSTHMLPLSPINVPTRAPDRPSAAYGAIGTPAVPTPAVVSVAVSAPPVVSVEPDSPKKTTSGPRYSGGRYKRRTMFEGMKHKTARSKGRRTRRSSRKSS